MCSVNFHVDNEVWLDSGMSEDFTSPNYPSAYHADDSVEWVFCVSIGLNTHKSIILQSLHGFLIFCVYT